MGLETSLEKLRAFKLADKYETFHKAMPGIILATDNQKEIITQILDNCCAELIRLFLPTKKPLKTTLKQVIATYMDEISRSAADNANKDFAYELCWYLSDIAGLKMKLSSERKTWGYWKVADNEVKIFNKKKAGNK